MLIFVAGCLVAVALWAAAMRKRPEFAIFGIAIGLVLAGAAAVASENLHLKTFPIWLPPLPFAVVAFLLFFFGALAWWWGRDR